MTRRPGIDEPRKVKAFNTIKPLAPPRPLNRQGWTQVALAFAIVLMVYFVLGALLQGYKVDTQMKDIFLILLGALLSRFGDVYGYFFGSSEGSNSKNTAIAALSEKVNPTEYTKTTVETKETNDDAGERVAAEAPPGGGDKPSWLQPD